MSKGKTFLLLIADYGKASIALGAARAEDVTPLLVARDAAEVALIRALRKAGVPVGAVAPQ